MPPVLSFRARILLLVLGVGLVPMAVMGLWFTERMRDSGEALLRERLRTVLDEERTTIERRWIPYRSALLDLVERPDVREALREQRDGSPSGDARGTAPESVEARFRALDAAVTSVELRTLEGRTLWRLERPEPASPGLGRPLPTRLSVHERVTGEELGTLIARVHLYALRQPGGGTAMVGALLTAVDTATGVEVLPSPVDPSLLEAGRFRWNDQTWLVEGSALVEPAVVLRAAAPLAPFAGPLRDAARSGLWMILTVVVGGLVIGLGLTRRLTGSLEHLSDAATAVADGDLDRRVDVGGEDEIGRLARAFNTMTENLQRTLARLAERESLAAVNEFAAALAHEVRNPLTAIRLDLQRIEEGLPEGSPLRPLQARVLEDIRSLDRTVEAALATARSGRIEIRDFDVREPLEAAVHAAEPAFAEKGADLSPPGAEEPVSVSGDPDALERVFLNLLLNAAEAVEAGGRASLEIVETEEGVRVSIEDDGRGMTDEELARAFEPFFTTRSGGTGVGLPVARRIVTAHGGELRLDSRPGEGTTAVVELPHRNESFQSR